MNNSDQFDRPPNENAAPRGDFDMSFWVVNNTAGSFMLTSFELSIGTWENYPVNIPANTSKILAFKYYFSNPTSKVTGFSRYYMEKVGMFTLTWTICPGNNLDVASKYSVTINSVRLDNTYELKLENSFYKFNSHSVLTISLK